MEDRSLNLKFAFVLMLVVTAFVATVPTAFGGPAVREHSAHNCGSVTPPLPPGLHEGFSFFKVTAKDLGCSRAKRVARKYVVKTNTDGLKRARHIKGFRCRQIKGGSVVRCKRGHKIILGYNGGI